MSYKKEIDFLKNDLKINVISFNEENKTKSNRIEKFLIKVNKNMYEIFVDTKLKDKKVLIRDIKSGKEERFKENESNFIPEEVSTLISSIRNIVHTFNIKTNYPKHQKEKTRDELHDSIVNNFYEISYSQSLEKGVSKEEEKLFKEYIDLLIKKNENEKIIEGKNLEEEIKGKDSSPMLAALVDIKSAQESLDFLRSRFIIHEKEEIISKLIKIKDFDFSKYKNFEDYSIKEMKSQSEDELLIGLKEKKLKVLEERLLEAKEDKKLIIESEKTKKTNVLDMSEDMGMEDLDELDLMPNELEMAMGIDPNSKEGVTKRINDLIKDIVKEKKEIKELSDNFSKRTPAIDYNDLKKITDYASTIERFDNNLFRVKYNLIQEVNSLPNIIVESFENKKLKELNEIMKKSEDSIKLLSYLSKLSGDEQIDTVYSLLKNDSLINKIIKPIEEKEEINSTLSKSKKRTL